MSSYKYTDPHVKDKTVATVLSLTWEYPYLEKTVLILRQESGGWHVMKACVRLNGFVQLQKSMSRSMWSPTIYTDTTHPP